MDTEPEYPSEESVFEDKFDAREYMEMYYPKFTELDLMLKIVAEMRENPKGHYEIDALAKKTSAKHELIENIAIFDFFRVVIEHLLEEFPLGDAEILDIGGGPTIYQHMGLCLIANHITHSEFLEKNRNEVLLWLHEEERAHEWDTYFHLVQKLFCVGEIPRILERQIRVEDPRIAAHAKLVQELLTSEDIHNFKHQVRMCLGSDVVHGDMFLRDLGLSDHKQYDLVTSNFVAESAATNVEQWKTAMHNIIAHVRPGGYFVQTAIHNAHWYQVGKERLPAVAVDREMIIALCEKEGCRVIYEKALTGSDVDTVGYDGMVFILAQKIA